MTRRSFLGRLTALALGGIALPVSRLLPRDPPPAGAFRFVALSDLHHAGPECTPFVQALVERLKAESPLAFCLILGDLSDAGDPASLRVVRETFSGLGVPVHVVPGNHDCDLTKDTSLFAETFPGSLNYTFGHGGWQFVAFDSTDGNRYAGTRISAASLAFLEDAAQTLDSRLPTLAFTHFPLAADVPLASLNAGEALMRLTRLNLRATLSGHFHGHTLRTHGKAVLRTLACCSRRRDNHDGTAPEGYLVCTAHSDGTLETEFVEFPPATPANAPEPLF